MGKGIRRARKVWKNVKAKFSGSKTKRYESVENLPELRGEDEVDDIQELEEDSGQLLTGRGSGFEVGKCTRADVHGSSSDETFYSPPRPGPVLHDLDRSLSTSVSTRTLEQEQSVFNESVVFRPNKPRNVPRGGANDARRHTTMFTLYENRASTAADIGKLSTAPFEGYDRYSYSKSRSERRISAAELRQAAERGSESNDEASNGRHIDPEPSRRNEEAVMPELSRSKVWKSEGDLLDSDYGSLGAGQSRGSINSHCSTYSVDQIRSELRNHDSRINSLSESVRSSQHDLNECNQIVQDMKEIMGTVSQKQEIHGEELGRLQFNISRMSQILGPLSGKQDDIDERLINITRERMGHQPEGEGELIVL